jgi:glycosyltransferase involved in cell wall biosynthesis
MNSIYTIVIPVYQNEETVLPLFERLEKIREFVSPDFELEVVFVIDGSRDCSKDKIKSCLENSKITASILEHSRNFGAVNAVRTGLQEATGDYVAVMAADLQEPIDLYYIFISELQSRDYDLIIGNRIGRNDPKFTRILALVSWSIIRKLVNNEIPKGGADVFACNREVVNELVALQESNTSLIGNLYWVGFRRKYVDYERLSRVSGKSTWTFRKKINYFLDSLYSFTEFPIVFISLLGIFGIIFSAAVSLVVVVSRILGYIEEPGYTPIILAISMASSANLFALGVLGNYISRIYANVKGRPNAIVSSKHRFNAAD